MTDWISFEALGWCSGIVVWVLGVRNGLGFRTAGRSPRTSRDTQAWMKVSPPKLCDSQFYFFK